MENKDILSMDITELNSLLQGIGEPKFRGKQIFSWLHNKNVREYSDMKNIPISLREKLSNISSINGVTILKRLESKTDGTIKYLFKTKDNSIIEGVLMRYAFGNAICVSSQIGCRMGCSFCASTLEGMERSLTAGEIASQIYEVQKDIKDRVSNVVLMGSGEPLDNYDNVLRFIRLINSEDSLNIGQRHITLSTCGLSDKIIKLSYEKLQITLAISLHAPNDELRRTMMPVSNAYPLDGLIKACHEYVKATGRRITFEYALISGVNDSKECALELSRLLLGLNCHINLIPVNDVKERSYKRSSENKINEFSTRLTELGIETTIRRRLGSDINAACGQLRRGYIKDGIQEVL